MHSEVRIDVLKTRLEGREDSAPISLVHLRGHDLRGLERP
jgi:hypothetical protein